MYMYIYICIYIHIYILYWESSKYVVFLPDTTLNKLKLYRSPHHPNPKMC